MGNLQALLYYPIFLAVMLVVTIVHFYRLYPMDTDSLLDKKKPMALVTILVVAVILFLGLRPISGRAFGDTSTYAAVYMLMTDDLLLPDYTRGDWLFNFIMYSCSKIMSVQYFFLLIEVLYMVPIYFACKRFSSENAATLIIFALTAFSFFSYGVNGIRNGAASSIFMLALSFMKGEKPWEKIVFLVLSFVSYNLHHSMALPIAASVAAYFITNPKLMFYFWVASIAASLTIGGSISEIFSGLGFDERKTQHLHHRGNRGGSCCQGRVQMGLPALLGDACGAGLVCYFPPKDLYEDIRDIAWNLHLRQRILGNGYPSRVLQQIRLPELVPLPDSLGLSYACHAGMERQTWT